MPFALRQSSAVLADAAIPARGCSRLAAGDVAHGALGSRARTPTQHPFTAMPDALPAPVAAGGDPPPSVPCMERLEDTLWPPVSQHTCMLTLCVQMLPCLLPAACGVAHGLPGVCVVAGVQCRCDCLRVRAQMLPYLRAAAADLPLAVSRMERLAAALRAEWFAGGAPPAAAPLLEYAGVLARSLEQQRGDPGSGGGGAAGGPGVSSRALAGRLAAVLVRLGDGARAARLRSAYKL